MFVNVVSPTVRRSTRASFGQTRRVLHGAGHRSGSPRRSASSRRRKSRAKPDSRSSRVSQRAHSARTSARRSSSVRVAVSSIVMLPLVSPRGSPRGVSLALSGWCLAAAAPRGGGRAHVGARRTRETLPGWTYDAGRSRRHCPAKHDNAARRLRHSRHVIRSPTSHRWRRPRRRPPHGLQLQNRWNRNDGDGDRLEHAASASL